MSLNDILWVSGDGYVYSWGRGMFGRLGTGSESDELFPVRVRLKPEEKRVKFVGVAAGTYHSIALAGQSVSSINLLALNRLYHLF